MTSSSHAAEARHFINVSCPGGHTVRFDKRQLCSEKTDVYRVDSGDKRKNLCRLRLTCSKCGKELVVSVDCEGYR